MSSGAKYDPATQPGSPWFDGAEAYEAHLSALYPEEARMKYGCTPIGVTRIGDYVFDRDLGELEEAPDELDDDHSDEQFDRMDRQNELR
jgi:hypothetical protein